jgi:hypothetical protein
VVIEEEAMRERLESRRCRGWRGEVAGIMLAMKTKPATRRKRLVKRKARGSPPIEIYSDERVAEFLLNNSVDAHDYARACADVRKLGLDPAKIKHWKPPGVK